MTQDEFEHKVWTWFKAKVFTGHIEHPKQEGMSGEELRELCVKGQLTILRNTKAFIDKNAPYFWKKYPTLNGKSVFFWTEEQKRDLVFLISPIYVLECQNAPQC